MPQFELLGSLTRDLHQEFVRLYYLMLPVFFGLALAIAWFRSPQGSIEFIEILKKVVISTILLVAFPDISQAILLITDGIAERIDHMNSLDAIIRMAQEKSQTYSMSPKSLLLQFNDLVIATMSFLSYMLLYIARYLSIAMYHFFWIFFMISSPLLLLFNLFQGTSQITANLFKGMIEVASWKIVWAILGAMLAALSFGDYYKIEGNYLTLMVMNVVISIAMLSTPLVVRSLVGTGFQSMSSTFGPTVVAAMVALPSRVATVQNFSRTILNPGKSKTQIQMGDFKGRRRQDFIKKDDHE